MFPVGFFFFFFEIGSGANPGGGAVIESEAQPVFDTAGPSWKWDPICWQGLREKAAPGIRANGTKVSRKSGQDDQDKFNLPTCFGFSEDILEAGARRFVTDAEFDRSGSKCFSRDEM
jgi:hypothetical protein